jgi:transposase InsO family protein
LDSKKKRLWEARAQQTVPDFTLLTIHSARWHPEPKGVVWVDELRRRVRCLRRYRECQAAAPATAQAKVCREFGICRRTLERRLHAYSDTGVEGLIPGSRRPLSSPRQTPAALESAILAIRLRSGWGVERIAQELKHLGLGPITHSGVWGVLKRRGLNVALGRRKCKAGCRYEREIPNDLWHMDVKGPLHFGAGLGPLYGVAILDDCSRFCVGATLERNRQMDTMLSLVEAAVSAWGAPRQLMSDNGSEFVGVGPRLTPSRFLVRLGELGIQHLPIKLRTPETNGKIERFWLTLEVELLMQEVIDGLTGGRQALASYLEEYNFNRRHYALSYRAPAQIYCPERAGTPMPAHIKALLPFLSALKEAGQSHE